MINGSVDQLDRQPALKKNWYIMSLDKHTAEQDFPLSGGEEPDFKVPKWVFVIFFVFISLIVAANLHMKGFF